MREKFVCTRCLIDPGLQKFIRRNRTDQSCSYCKTSAKRIATANILDLADHMERCLYLEYEDAAESISYCSSEGGYQWDTMMTSELLTDELQIEFYNGPNGEELLWDIVWNLPDHPWVEADPYGPRPHEFYLDSWARFCQSVMHSCRYLFINLRRRKDDYSDFSLTPAEILAYIAKTCRKQGLLRTIKCGDLFRARTRTIDQHWHHAKDLDRPPPERATKPNRMNPPGIPMFYAADDLKTAVQEATAEPALLAVGLFSIVSPLVLLDLTKIRDTPSLFDSDQHHTRPAVAFLRRFVRAITEPISSPDAGSIEYVPTQVVTEYFRLVQRWNGKPVQGIAYPSAQVAGSTCYVLFSPITADLAANIPVPGINPHPDLILRHVYEGQFDGENWHVTHEFEPASISA